MDEYKYWAWSHHLEGSDFVGMSSLARRRAPSVSVNSRRGPNHVLVTRRRSHAAQRAKVKKLLDSGRWESVHVHGLGAALAPAVLLAAELVQESAGRIVASCSTSTEALVDHHDPAESTGGDDDLASGSTLRHNSAIHISLSMPYPAVAASPAAPAGGMPASARPSGKESAQPRRKRPKSK